MKKSTTIGAIVFLGIIIGIVGLYAFLSGKSRDRNMDVSMTEVQRVLRRIPSGGRGLARLAIAWPGKKA